MMKKTLKFKSPSMPNMKVEKLAGVARSGHGKAKSNGSKTNLLHWPVLLTQD